MKITIKIFSLLTAIALVLNISGCKKTPDNSSSMSAVTSTESNKKNYLTLLYSSADTFNPYTAKTDINRQLCQLIFEPLLSLDNEFKAVYKIARTATVSGNSCTVLLNSIRFSDGSTVTADDVVYSCNLAKNSSSIYSSALYEVKNVSAVNQSTVEFTLTKNDPYFINNLTFPIIKAGSEKVTDSDSVVQPPIGSGKFIVSDDRLSLVANKNYRGESGNISLIKLINAPDIDSVSHYVEVGAADMYYSSISDGNILRMSGKKSEINLNNLVYIGVNQNYGALGENALRQAISSAIDRKKICQDSFYNHAVAANGFFNPVWKETKSVQNLQIETNSQITIENLEKIGYNRLDSKNNRTDKSGKTLSLSLLVNSENRLKVVAARQIATQLKAFGINISVIEKKYAEYLECLKNGEFQLYLGEIRLTDNMDISSLLLEGGTAAYGLKKASEPNTAESTQADNKEAEKPVTKESIVINGFYEGKNTIADIATVLQTEMPIIPICYRTGILFYNDNIENVKNSSKTDIYFSIESYIYNN